MSRNYYEPKPLFVERISELLTNQEDNNKFFNILKTEPPRSIRCNTLKISPGNLKKRLQENYGWKITLPFKNFPEIMIVEGKIANEEKTSGKDNSIKINGNVVQSSSKEFYVNKPNSEESWQSQTRSGNDNASLRALDPGELGRSLEHLLGYYYIQEIASMLPALVLDAKPSEEVLDLCASPGSKTTQISSMMENKGLLIANEVSLGRIKILSANIGRCGVSNVIVTKRDGIALCERIKKEIPKLKFDKILVDAPCSGEGTIRSTPSTNKMWNENTIFRLSRIQKKLVESGLEILKVGGEIVYSTCTHAPEENEEVLNYILTESKWKSKIKIEPLTASLPSELETRQGITEWNFAENKKRFHNSDTSLGGAGGGEGGQMKSLEKKFHPSIKNSVRIYPQDNNTEGFFIAKLKKMKE